MPTKRKRTRAPGAGRPVTTGSAGAPLVQYRVSAELHARAAAAAAALGLTIGQLAHAALEAELGRLAPW